MCWVSTEWKSGSIGRGIKQVGKTAAMQRSYDGRQPGDPAKVAAAIIAVSKADKPPLRLVLGRDAYARAERNDEGRLGELRAWKSTSKGTDFPREVK